jgi:hypothetical protein
MEMADGGWMVMEVEAVLVVVLLVLWYCTIDML